MVILYLSTCCGLEREAPRGYCRDLSSLSAHFHLSVVRDHYTQADDKMVAGDGK